MPVNPLQLYDAVVNVLGAQMQRNDQPCRHLKPSPAAGGLLKVRVAEDNVLNRRVALRLLERLGYQVDLARNGLEAPRVAGAANLRHCPDGSANTRNGRSRGQPAHPCNVPIRKTTVDLAMTANGMQGDREACLAAALNDYLRKPVQMAVLRTVLAGKALATQR